MSSRTKVSKLVRVTQGKVSVIFELTAKGLTVEHSDPDSRSGFTRFTLRKPAMDALRELLGMQQPSKVRALTPPKTLSDTGEVGLTLPPKEFDERFNQDESPPHELEDTPTDGSVSRAADGVETGMD